MWDCDAMVSADRDPDALYCAARWRLDGDNLPSRRDTIEVGSLARQALMGRARRLFGARNLPPALSGHGLPTDAGHKHLFFLPEDADGDGRIDHITVYRRGGFDNATLRCLVSLRRLWAGARGEWHVAEHWIARPGEVLGSLIAPSRAWVSATPFLMPRHPRRGWDEARQIRWQCEQMDLPAPAPSLVPDPAGPACWRLVRPGRPTRPPVPRGRFWRLEFPQPVGGPVALGYGCHFGLGSFRPATADH